MNRCCCDDTTLLKRLYFATASGNRYAYNALVNGIITIPEKAYPIRRFINFCRSLRGWGLPARRRLTAC
jgi:hypothetical protein